MERERRLRGVASLSLVCTPVRFFGREDGDDHGEKVK